MRDPDPDKLLEDSAETLAKITNCATITWTGTPQHVAVKRIELVPVNRTVAVLLISATNGVVKTQVCRLDFVINPEILDFFTKFANDRFAGKTLKEITSEYVGAVSVSLGGYAKVFTSLLLAIYELCKNIYDGQFFVGGLTNLLAYREFSDVAHDLLNMIRRRNEIDEIIMNQAKQTALYIGRENSRSELADASVLIAKFNIGADNCGAVGVIGPVRLNYSKLISHVDYFAETLGKLLSDTFEQG